MRFVTQSFTWILARRAISRAVLFALLWWALAEGAPAAWGLGVAAVGVATLISLAMLPATPWRWHWRGMAQFLPFFLWHSVKGSVDVARRALRRPLSLQPVLLVYPWRLPPGPARIFFANTANLLPGTLSAELQDASITMHILDESQSLMKELQALETRVAALFALPIPAADSPGEIRHA